MVVFEESLIFFPEPYPSGEWRVKVVGERTGTRVRDEFFTADDGTSLHGWWCEAAELSDRSAPSADMVLLWFHGNAGNLAHRAQLMAELARLPARVLIVDYRGYGRSGGRPSEQGLYRDARAAWRHLRDGLGVAEDRIVILGKSLGGAVAVQLASEVDAAGLIVESSFTSIPAMANHHYPFVPRWLVRTRMDSLDKIGAVRCPLMVVHSPDDEIVPFFLGRELYDAAKGDKRLIEIPGARHNELWLVGGEGYFAAVRDFLVHCRERERGGS
jgi:fermentation-respiration switch protein FrsA (DUF1100 family)